MELKDQVPDFSQAFANSDQVIVVEEQEFHVHRAVLGLWSPVFMAMFSSDFKEASLKKIELPDKKADIFRNFLLLLYSPNDVCLPGNTWMEEQTYQNILLTLEYIREYQAGKALQSVEKQLHDYIRERSSSYGSKKDKLQTYMRSLHLADKFGLEKVINAVLPMLKFFVQTIITSDKKFNLLSVDMKYKLMSEIAYQLETSLKEPKGCKDWSCKCSCCKSRTSVANKISFYFD